MRESTSPWALGVLQLAALVGAVWWLGLAGLLVFFAGYVLGFAGARAQQGEDPEARRRTWRKHDIVRARRALSEEHAANRRFRSRVVRRRDG